LLQILLLAASKSLRRNDSVQRLLQIRCTSSKPPSKTGKFGLSAAAEFAAKQQPRRLL